MTRILLIRHGNTDLAQVRLCGRLPGIGLNKEGREQAARLGLHLCEQNPITAIYSSPLDRATETAAIVAAKQHTESRPSDPHLAVSIDEGLVELDFGEWTGMRFEDLHGLEEWRLYNSRRSLFSAPGGESLTAVQARVWATLCRLQEQHDGETIAVVTHADVIRAVLVLLLGMPLDNLLRLEIGLASVTEVMLGQGDPVIVSINRIA